MSKEGHKYLYCAEVSSEVVRRSNIDNKKSLPKNRDYDDETMELLAKSEEVDSEIIYEVVVFERGSTSKSIAGYKSNASISTKYEHILDSDTTKRPSTGKLSNRRIRKM